MLWIVSRGKCDKYYTIIGNTVSNNSGDKKLRYEMDCYIHTISLETISLSLLAVISIGCYYYYRRHWVKKV